MQPEAIISQFMKKNQNILQIGGPNQDLRGFAEADSFLWIDSNNVGDLADLDKKFDYAVLSDVLELIDEPVELIKQVKNIADEVYIYEFKYDEGCVVQPEWKQPWKKVGLEYTLSFEFDYVNTVYFGYASLHICNTPYNGDEKKGHPDAIR